MHYKRITIFLVIFIVLLTNLFFGFSRLSKYSAVDEPYWTYKRIPKFWTAIQDKKWRSTNINDKPGITVALVSGVGLLSVDPLPYKSIRQEPKSAETAKKIQQINFSFRWPIYLVSFFFLILFFLLLKKLLGTSIALLSLIFIGLSPIILGISLIVNPDSLLWGFLPLSIISYLVYQKEKNKYYLILSGIFLGLSILTKYVANILYVYFLGLLFLEYIYNSHHQKNFFEYFKKAFFDYLILVATSMAVFFFLFPASWHTPKMVLEGTIFSKAFKSTWPFFLAFLGLILADLIFVKSRFTYFILKYLAKYKQLLKKITGGFVLLSVAFILINVYSGMKIFNFESMMASPKGGSGFVLSKFVSQVLADLYALIFGLTPLVFLSFIFGVFANSFKKEIRSKKSVTVLYFLIFIIFYYIASSVNHVTATVRYQIVLYPLASIIAAIGFYQFINLPKIKKYFRAYWANALVIIFSIISLLSIAPFYFCYASSFLPQKYVLNLKDMGDGSYEASQYLNSLPNAKQLVIWSDKGAVCESFVGLCKVGFHKNDVKGFNFNYFVVSNGRKNRSLKMSGPFEQPVSFTKLYSSDSPASFRINIGNRSNDFEKVVKTQDILSK